MVFSDRAEPTLQSFALKADATTLWNLSIAEMKTGHALEALRHVRVCIRMPNVDANYTRLAPAVIERLSAQTSHLSIDAPSGAEIYVDGEKQAENAPLSSVVDVPEGTHVVEARLNGKSAKENASTPLGTTAQVKLVFADGAAPVSTTSAMVPGGSGDVPGGGGIEQPPPSHSFWTTGRAIGTGIVVVGIGAVVGGVVFEGAASSKGSQANDVKTQLGPQASCAGSSAPPQCGQLDQLNRDHNKDSGLGAGFLIGGGAMVIGGVVMFLLSPPKNQTSAWFSPEVAPGLLKMGVSGRF